jgi:hypothetical protein
MGFFSPIFLDFGYQLEITIENPGHLVTQASVIWCQEYQTSSKIISERGRFSYRIGVEFTPINDEQKKSIELFFNTLIHKNVLVDE